MKSILLLALLTAFSFAPVQAATCSGGPNCNACTNCNYCRNCSQEGGYCSVCHKYEAPKAAKKKTGKAKKTK